ncbi:MrcB family domain-containing protein [Phytohalomonas tamaricis]|uniref:MrcB family domain-containing protein n=1 Tax=Phytohalomonas tamaricis TaxID=2081032 RepID=UPI000D0AE84C|nr:DUF3578 domain-containing protein [Phytohalomonas tamaricis]
MPNLSRLIEDFSYNYLSEKSTYIKAKKTVPSWSKIVNIIPNEFVEFLSLPYSFKVIGSIGKGNITEIPWICFFDKDITISAQFGYYIVLLFKTDMTGFFVSLNQGWTQYENEYGVKKGKRIIKENAQIAQNSLRTIADFNKDTLDLGATRPLGKGYELGNIASKYFSLSKRLDEDELFQTFRALLAAYSELKGSVGIDILNIKSLISEDLYQSAVQKSEPKEIESGPAKLRSQKLKGSTNSWPRSVGISKAALDKAGYKCEADETHQTFMANVSGQQFMEAHHLIPMEFQEEFIYSIDVPENIVSLCPNCHRKVHLSVIDEKLPLLEKLFMERIGSLKERGIRVGFDKFRSFYE